MYALAHLCFALALAYVVRLPLVTTMLAAVLPDLDALFTFGFPLTHRGVMHSLAAAVVLAVAVYPVTDRRKSAYAFLLGYQSHLFLDTLTPYGVMWFYPVAKYISLKLALAASLQVNVAVAILSLAVVYVWKLEPRLWSRLRRSGWLL